MIRCIRRMGKEYDDELAELLGRWWPSMHAERTEAKRLGTLSGIFVSIAKRYCEKKEPSGYLSLEGRLMIHNFGHTEDQLKFLDAVAPFSEHLDDHAAYFDRVEEPPVSPEEFSLISCEFYSTAEMLEAIPIADPALSDLRTLKVWEYRYKYMSNDDPAEDEFDPHGCMDFVGYVVTFEKLFEHRDHTIEEFYNWDDMCKYTTYGFEYFLARYDWHKIRERGLVPHFLEWLKTRKFPVSQRCYWIEDKENYSFYKQWVESAKPQETDSEEERESE